jgi:tRNA threonylcarbamoyladenosine biosynthesis protein TsaB
MPGMRVLALETATHRLSVAYWDDGVVAENAIELPNGGSAWLLPAALALLDEAGIAMTALDAIAFGAGPGSFTGVRLAAGCAQGLAFGLDRPVIGVDSLAALALASGEARAYVCLDARMNEVYVAAYDRGVEILAPKVCPPERVPLPEGDDWVGCGDGFASYAARLPALRTRRPELRPTAAAVARLAAPKLADGAGMDAALAAPRYVRDKVALTTAERLARGGLK